MITFDIDENQVQKNAEAEAGRQIAERIVKMLFGDRYGYSESRVREFAKDVVEEMFKPHKDEIIDGAIKAVAENLHRTKTVKAKLEEVLDGDTCS